MAFSTYTTPVSGRRPGGDLPVQASITTASIAPPCRLCGTGLRRTFVDLGMSPLCESFLDAEDLNRMEAFYPLHVRICEECLLVQLETYVPAEEIFGGDYAYFSAYSDSWVEHARVYAERMTERLALSHESLVVELASNDGYLLQHFVRAGIPALGIDPARNVAEAARARGVDTLCEFFGADLAERLVEERGYADLVVANNVVAHVPDVTDFVDGMRILLAPDGVATIEVPHLVRLVEGLQFDTIYHEHYSYFSFHTLVRLFREHGLHVFDVEELPSHGGSLRVFVRRADGEAEDAVAALLERERAAGYDSLEGYEGFGERVAEAKRRLLELLIGLRRDGARIAGYGAPGKGNTLLNYCGIRTDFLEYTVDRNPGKHGKFLPGTHIPIYPPERIAEMRPDYVLILPWNLKREIAAQLDYVREWGGRLIVPIPEPEVLP
jgi:SAM-dependent methyltransferase